jgi:hypothetical protein
MDNVEHGNCPRCNTSFIGAPIDPKHFVHDKTTDAHKASVAWSESRGDRRTRTGEPWCSCLPYGDLPENERFYSRLIGIEIQGGYDGVSYWMCPDCEYTWDRWTGEERKAPHER